MENVQGKKKESTAKGKILPALCNVCGTLMLLAVIALAVPLTVPAAMGYQVYDVISGSMEPAIPVGSAIYVKPVDASTIAVGDVVAYQYEGDVIAHRVTLNSSATQELITKGDANEVEDFNPIPYREVIGRVEANVPIVGTFMSIYASTVGKVYLILIAACGVMLNMLAGRMRDVHAGRKPGKADGAAGAEGAEGATTARKGSAGKRLRQIAMVLLAFVFISSAAVIGFTMWQYAEASRIYDEASDKYTGAGTNAPIEVDFKALQKENPDIVGWIYCEDTVINYPVLQGKDNDQYLHTDYQGDYNIDGSIFVDADNTPGFVDSNTIIYGHHMNSGAMFAGLVNWADQEYYEKHPVIWLLTPEKNYKIILFSGHHIASSSSMYDIIKLPGKEMNTLLSEALELSDFKTDVKLNPNGRYVMLSTCAYLFDGDRYVLHGVLVTVQ